MTCHECPADFIGIGVQKSATSWLANCLAEHPHVCIGRDKSGRTRKELHFFDRPKYHKGMRRYCSFFRHCPAQMLTGEFTPNYMYESAAADRIATHCPNARLIVCLRAPIDRAYSHYRWLTRANTAALAHFDEAIQRYPDIIERGMYAAQLKRYLSRFRRDQIFVTLYEDVQNKPYEVVASLYRFLGLDSAFVPSVITHRFGATPAVSYRVPALERARQLLHRAGDHLKRFDGTARLLKRSGIKNLDKRLKHINTKPAITDTYDTIPSATRSRLRERYAPDVAELEQLIGRDLSHWLS